VEKWITLSSTVLFKTFCDITDETPQYNHDPAQILLCWSLQKEYVSSFGFVLEPIMLTTSELQFRSVPQIRNPRTHPIQRSPLRFLAASPTIPVRISTIGTPDARRTSVDGAGEGGPRQDDMIGQSKWRGGCQAIPR